MTLGAPLDAKGKSRRCERHIDARHMRLNPNVVPSRHINFEGMGRCRIVGFEVPAKTKRRAVWRNAPAHHESLRFNHGSPTVPTSGNDTVCPSWG